MCLVKGLRSERSLNWTLGIVKAFMSKGSFKAGQGFQVWWKFELNLKVGLGGFSLKGPELDFRVVLVGFRP